MAFTVFAQQHIEIGQWRDHLSYYTTHNVCQVDDRVLVAAQSSLFFFDPKTKEMEKLSKVNGLSDAGLGVVAYDTTTASIVITYENSNIDIVQKGIVYNIPDIKNHAIEGSKSINSIYFADNRAYLSCGFGIVVLDLIRHEIYDTWYLGENSSAIRVNCVYINDTSIFAGTVNGLLYADKHSNALAASSSWHRKNLSNGVTKEVNYIIPFDSGHMAVNVLNIGSTISNLLKYDGNSTDTLLSTIYIQGLKKIGDRIGVLSYQAFSIYDTNMNQLYHYSNEWNPIGDISLDAADFYFNEKYIWFAHQNSGLLQLENYQSSYGAGLYFPDGPYTNDVYSITADSKGKFYIAPGGKDNTNANKFLRGMVYVYNNYYWDTLKSNLTDNLRDILNVAIDPEDNNHLMLSSWYNGVIEVRNDTMVKLYTEANTDSLLVPYQTHFRVASVKYDYSGNLFVANSLVPYGFVYLTYNNEWGNFYTAPYILSDDIMGMTLDYFNSYKLLYTYTGRILLVNNQGGMLWINPNNGSLLQTSKVNCIVQDKDGEMWIGTEKGIKVIYSLYGAFDNPSASTSNVQCNNIVYSENGIAQYLLSFENITCIMVDGANRKWIGTERNGVYVLSANGDSEIAHFTLENSPLFSNKIISMAQNPLNGEVFIGTDRGLISYRAESTEPATEDGSLRVYPNPVRPGYTGMIAINGFVDNSDVKITDANGRMVAHLKSLGGQAVWDGKNFNGQYVATGVYFIFSSANEGENKADGKILIIR